MQIVSISEDTGERYSDVISSGGKAVEQPAPLLAVYDMKISFNDKIHTVKAEVRSSPHGEQVDWSDELYFTESEGSDTLNRLIYDHFNKQLSEFPIALVGGRMN